MSLTRCINTWGLSFIWHKYDGTHTASSPAAVSSHSSISRMYCNPDNHKMALRWGERKKVCWLVSTCLLHSSLVLTISVTHTHTPTVNPLLLFPPQWLRDKLLLLVITGHVPVYVHFLVTYTYCSLICKQTVFMNCPELILHSHVFAVLSCEWPRLSRTILSPVTSSPDDLWNVAGRCFWSAPRLSKLAWNVLLSLDSTYRLFTKISEADEVKH